jgi:formate hydrogenlyase subunit 6/NADH:ubiquinone oxidoreductase subunit I
MLTQANSYWKSVGEAIRSLSGGLVLTLRHIWRSRKSKMTFDISRPEYFEGQRGIATIQFPHETIPVPDTGRYQLDNEIEDCIVCDKCAKVCPVDCITIEPIKSATEFGKTSDGTPKRIYAAKFDIDMGKCCFCGLCTTVCPTECLTMTKTYDYSVLDMKEHNFGFGNMTESEVEQRVKEWETFSRNKAAELSANPVAEAPKAPAAGKPVFKPRVKPPDNTGS